MRCVLIGNYGDANFGDEALKQYFLSRFPEVGWVVVSAQPSLNEVPRLPLGIRSLLKPWWKTISAIRHADAVVFGGGTLFTDVESVRACLLWWMHARLGRLFGKQRLFCFQGIGPFRMGIGRWLARDALKNSAVITVRDAQSAERVRRMFPNTEVVQSFDPVFSLFEEKKQGVRTGNVLGVVPRLNSGDSFEKLAREEWGSGRYGSVRILSFQPEHPGERAICARLLSILGTGKIVPIRSMDDASKAYDGLGMVVTHRFHGAIAAAGLNIPMRICVQAAGDKLSALSAELADAAALAALRKRIRAGEEALEKALR